MAARPRRAPSKTRADNPMWGKRKIAGSSPRGGPVRSLPSGASSRLVERGAVVPVPILRRRPGGRRIRFTHPALRPAPGQGTQSQDPGELVQIDTLFVNIRPDKPIKHFTAYDPVAK